MEISVIVPVYNVEKYLYRCVESILNQSFKDYELILVDDGSTDKSGNICDEYAKKYEYVRVIHKKNGGPSETRNTGILQANGNYVTYIDSDDYVSNDYLECLYNLLMLQNADIACARFCSFDDQGVINNDNCNKTSVRTYSGKNACIALLNEKDFQTSSCNLLIKKEIAIENLFPIGKYHEDELTTFKYFLAAEKVAITDKIIYYYYQREGSIMHIFGRPVIDEIAAADYYVDYCSKISKELYKASLNKKYSLYLHVLKNYPQIRTEYKETFLNMKRFLYFNSIRQLLAINTLFDKKKTALKFLLHLESI